MTEKMIEMTIVDQVDMDALHQELEDVRQERDDLNVALDALELRVHLLIDALQDIENLASKGQK